MPARIVIVHSEEEFLGQLSVALKEAGHEVAAFVDSMAALAALDHARTVEILITRAEFPAGQPNGVALALMARTKRPGIQVIFVALPQHAGVAEGLGAFLPMPVNAGEVVQTVERLLNPPDLQDPGGGASEA
jgi:DNA-binding NtrC family response regulator